MKVRAHRVVPPLAMAVMTAIPAGTAVEMLTHANAGAGALGRTGGGPLARAPQPNAAPAQTPAGTTSANRPAAGTATQTYQGPVVDGPYGPVQARITVSGKRITDVSISAPMDSPRSAGINSQAVPMLRSETLQAQSANVNLISGATITSEAYIQSLQGALGALRSGSGVTASGSTTSSGGGALSAPGITHLSGGGQGDD